MSFTTKARSVTRRGDFYKHQVRDINGKLKTWISTGADDVFITDVRDCGSMIDPDEVVEMLNQAKAVAALLDELNALSGSITSDELKARLAPIHLNSSAHFYRPVK